MIDLSALRSLLAVHRHGSVVSAASALDFTPSAVSQQIKRLERQQGTALLERVGRGVVLTEAGRLLADRGGQVLDELEALEHATRSAAPVGPFHLASFATANRGLVAPAAASLARTADELVLSVTEGDPRDVLRLVARGSADAGIVHDWESVHLDVPPDLETSALLLDRADVVVAADHPFAGRDQVTPRELVAESWVCTPPGTICHDWLLTMFARHELRPMLRYIDSEYASHLAFARSGVAVGLVPRLGRGPLPEGVVAVPVTDPVPLRRVQLVWRRGRADSASLRTVREALEAVAGGAAGS